VKRLFFAVLVILSLLASVAPGCGRESLPGAFTDDFGRVVDIGKPPQRIVSHVPGITEILFALGLEERVAGVSDFCDYPAEAESKTRVGGFFDPSVEMIVALNPDLVLTNGEVEYLLPQLEALGITFIVLHPDDINGIMSNIELVGRFTGTEKRARELVEDMEDRIARVTTRVKDVPGVRAFYTFASTDLNNPWTAGPGSFIDSLITLAGGENIAARAQAPWVQFSLEALVAADPEVIVVDASHGSALTPEEELRQHPVWREITALKRNRVYTIDGDLVSRAGPRIVQALEKIAGFLHPELFR